MVSERAMKSFIDACCDYRLKFEIWPTIHDITENEEVVLNTTPFRGEKAHILKVAHTKNGIRLTIGLHIMSGIMLLKIPDVQEKDILRKQDGFKINDDHLIDNTQRRILAILSRRVNKKQTEETMAKDMAMLDLLYNYRYHTIENKAAYRHLLALMLICAHLRKDNEGKEELVKEVEKELEDISRKDERKAATDVRTYLQIAMYIATGNAAYRNEAKKYVAEHAPKSKSLRRFIKLIRVKRIK